MGTRIEPGAPGRSRVGKPPGTLPSAGIVALLLLVTTGIGYRALAAYYGAAPTSTPLARGTLERIPLAFPGWSGREVALDERIVAATDTDDHVNRRYVQHATRQEVGLFVAYGLRMRDLLPHRPEVCYPGAGWVLQDRREVTFEPGEAGPATARIHQFSKGTLSREKVMVLSYYLIDGVYSSDVALLRSRSWRPGRDARYVVQVQVTSAMSPLVNAASVEKSVRDLASASAPAIREVVEEEVAAVARKHGQ